MLSFPLTLPIRFCDKETLFRKCIQLSDNECLDAANLVTKQCMKQFESQIPPKLGSVNWGSKIGACAGGEFIRLMLDTKKDRVNTPCIENEGKNAPQPTTAASTAPAQK